MVKADKGRDALVLLERDQACDVILCDLMMGDMTGMDLHAEVERRWPQLAQRFVFMTGGAFIEAASKFLKRIPNACVEKPFDLDTLRAAVATRR